MSHRLVALIAAYNEERYLPECLRHLRAQGAVAYLLDHQSTDRTRHIAEQHLGRGVLGIETIERADDCFDWAALLERKDALSRQLDGDWFMHCDPDELRLPPPGFSTLVDALDAAEADGANACTFQEFTFLPTLEEPDHDHPAFIETLRHYYAFSPRPMHRVNVWRRQPVRVGLAEQGGHRLDFPGLSVWPVSFRLKHYPILSRDHAVEKYGGRAYLARNVARGFHGWRARLSERIRNHEPLDLALPSASELRRTASDDDLDATHAATRHIWMERWADQVRSLALTD